MAEGTAAAMNIQRQACMPNHNGFSAPPAALANA
jgi:hypothetical protein